jgi:signal transduction histidine kinase
VSASGSARSTGIGLANLRERLARVGGPGAECRVAQQDGRVEVALLLPRSAIAELAAEAS